MNKCNKQKVKWPNWLRTVRDEMEGNATKQLNETANLRRMSSFRKNKSDIELYVRNLKFTKEKRFLMMC